MIRHATILKKKSSVVAWRGVFVFGVALGRSQSSAAKWNIPSLGIGF
jgi:hypothetical protein